MRLVVSSKGGRGALGTPPRQKAAIGRRRGAQSSLHIFVFICVFF